MVGDGNDIIGSRHCLCTFYGTVYLCENQQATIDLYTEHDITGWCHVNHRGYMDILCVLRNSVDNCNCNENCNGFCGVVLAYMPEYVPCTMVKYETHCHKIYPMLSGNDDVVQEIGGAKFPTMSEMVVYTID